MLEPPSCRTIIVYCWFGVYVSGNPDISQVGVKSFWAWHELEQVPFEAGAPEKPVYPLYAKSIPAETMIIKLLINDFFTVASFSK